VYAQSAEQNEKNKKYIVDENACQAGNLGFSVNCGHGAISKIDK
jgi:hypothetical protein